MVSGFSIISLHHTARGKHHPLQVKVTNILLTTGSQYYVVLTASLIYVYGACVHNNIIQHFLFFFFHFLGMSLSSTSGLTDYVSVHKLLLLYTYTGFDSVHKLTIIIV